MLVEFLRHPDVSRRDAIGWLKSSVDYIRERESVGDGNN